MNTKNTGAVDALLIAAMLAAEAVVAIVRLLLVPLLAVLIVALTPRRRPAPQPAPIAPEPPAVAAEPVLAPLTLATIAAELLELPAVELRELTGCRRKVAKQRMVDAWLAMPI